MNALLNNSSLISWITKGEERFNQVLLRFDMQDNQPFMKVRRSPPSCIKRGANRAKDTKQSHAALNDQKYVSDRELAASNTASMIIRYGSLASDVAICGTCINVQVVKDTTCVLLAMKEIHSRNKEQLY